MANAPPVCSPPIGAAGSCLRRFIVHFRRPDNYSGQYGFDWLREEYIEPKKFVHLVGSTTPLCKNPTKLKQEYKKDVKNLISPYGKEYYPAWLALFTYIPKVKNPNISDMTKNGAQLDLRIDEVDSLVSDGTRIIFRPGNSSLKVTPASIGIEEVINSGKKTNGSLNYYHLRKKINVKCHNGFLSNHEEIKVIAKLGSTEVEVGKLMLYKNDIIKHADIVLVNLITDLNGGKPVSPKKHQYYEYLIKKKAFNQSLIRAEVKVERDFDLTALTANADVQTFLNNSNSLGSTQFAQALRNLYNKYGPYKVSGGIDGPANDKKTFLFFTTRQTSAGGVCTLYGSNWGDMVILFKSNLTHDHSIPHELGHSFSLPHLFQPTSPSINPYHEFYRGYTENYMDYTSTQPLTGGSSHANPFNSGPHTFFKWQWDIMRADRSMY